MSKLISKRLQHCLKVVFLLQKQLLLNFLFGRGTSEQGSERENPGGAEGERKKDKEQEREKRGSSEAGLKLPQYDTRTPSVWYLNS